MPFAQLGLSQPILRALAKEGYETPTPIQAQCIPHILQTKDVLGCAQTGTGKTAAFALPIIQRLMEMPVDKSRRGPAKARALILSPTRELAIQIRDSFNVYGRESGLRSTVIFGGVSQLRQVQSLRDGVDIIIATPGRLIDLMDQRKAHLDEVKILVLDEADRMLDMGFIQPIRLIASRTPADRQTLFFSATMPPEIRKLADSLLKNPVSVAVTPVASAAPKIEQLLYHVNRADKQALLTLLLADRAMSRVVVFTKTKHGADKVGRKLHMAGVNAETIHGNKAQNARKKALDLFRAGKARVLVATDVAARGLDVDNITHVINFDLPMEPEAYVHRIGRTGRAGATGIAISFCDHEEKGLLKDVERLLKSRIPTKPLPVIDRAAMAAADNTTRQIEPRYAQTREAESRNPEPRYTDSRHAEHKPYGQRSRSGAYPRPAGSQSGQHPRKPHGAPAQAPHAPRPQSPTQRPHAGASYAAPANAPRPQPNRSHANAEQGSHPRTSRTPAPNSNAGHGHANGRPSHQPKHQPHAPQHAPHSAKPAHGGKGSSHPSRGGKPSTPKRSA